MAVFFQRLPRALFIWDKYSLSDILCQKVKVNTFYEDYKPSLNIQKISGCGQLSVFPHVRNDSNIPMQFDLGIRFDLLCCKKTC